MELSAQVEGCRVKICTKCKTEYNEPELYFKKDSSKKDGLYPSCKKCNHKDWAKNYPNIMFKHRQRTSLYASLNKDKVAQYHQKWYMENQESMLEKSKRYRETNPESVKLNKKAYKQKRRAILAKVDNTLTKNDIKNQYDNQNGKCFYCGKEVNLDYHVDHIKPISRGGANTPENIVISCPSCNLSKGYKSVDQFMQIRHRWRVIETI